MYITALFTTLIPKQNLPHQTGFVWHGFGTFFVWVHLLGTPRFPSSPALNLTSSKVSSFNSAAASPAARPHRSTVGR